MEKKKSINCFSTKAIDIEKQKHKVRFTSEKLMHEAQKKQRCKTCHSHGNLIRVASQCSAQGL